MKKTVTLFLIVMCTISVTPSFSQNILKIGHVNAGEILSSLPEKDSIIAVLEKERSGFETAYEEMMVEYNKLLYDYEKNTGTFSDLVRKAKEEEILDKKSRIDEFGQNAAVVLENRYSELMQPLINRMSKAIETVAEENGFTYILDTSKGTVVYTSRESQCIDTMVMAELGYGGKGTSE